MYLNLVQLAESFGVSERTVKGWVEKEGLPFIMDRKRLVFERAQVAEWAAARGLATQAGFLAKTGLSATMKLSELLERGGIWRDVDPGAWIDVLGDILSGLPGMPASVCAMLCKRLAAPGGLTLAPIGEGWALPHPAVRVALGPASGFVALILLARSLDTNEGTPDRKPIQRLFFFVAPTPRLHLDCLARLTRLAASGKLDSGMDDVTLIKAVESFEAENWKKLEGESA